MKSKIVTSTDSFIPVVIQFTLETQEELDTLASMFSCSPVCEAARKMGLELDSEAFVDAVDARANSGKTAEFAQNLLNSYWIKMHKK